MISVIQLHALTLEAIHEIKSPSSNDPTLVGFCFIISVGQLACQVGSPLQ